MIDMSGYDDYMLFNQQDVRNLRTQNMQNRAKMRMQRSRNSIDVNIAKGERASRNNNRDYITTKRIEGPLTSNEGTG